MKSIVFVCSPYAGDIERNKRVARLVCRQLIEEGFTPIAPHLFYPEILDDNDPEARELGINLGLDILSNCTRMFVYDRNGVSEGMKKELQFAEDNNIEVTYVPWEID